MEGRTRGAYAELSDYERNGLFGCDFPKGQTGVFAFGNGYYYYSYDASKKTEDGVRIYRSDVCLCRWTGEGQLFEKIEDGSSAYSDPTDY